MKRERRRYPRLRCTVQVQIKDRRNISELAVADVSRHGVFVVTDSPRPERELVQLSFQLPDAGSVEVLGMVARRVCVGEAEGDQQPGMGVDFFALSKEAKKVWDRFVLRSADGEAAEEGVDTSAPTRRKHPRNLSCFLVQLKDRDRLREFFTRDISTGGMFLRTPAPDKVSKRLELIIVHPETKEEFPIQGVVVRVVSRCALVERGVGVQFEPLTLDLEAALVTFIESGVDVLERGSSSQEERIERLSQAADMVGDSVQALALLGNALIEEMAPARAVKILKRALLEGPDDPDLHRGLFKAYNMMGDLDRAGRHLAAVRRLEGDS